MDDKIDFKRIILMTVAAAGILAIAILAPNALQVLKPFLRNKKKYNLKYYLNQKAKKLVKDGFLKINIENEKQFLLLTKKGEQKLSYYKITEKKKNNKWDGKWRVVIFDVWENTRSKRNLLRMEIKILDLFNYNVVFGFIRMSVLILLSCLKLIYLLVKI